MQQRLANIIVILCSALLVFYYSQKPVYNWDMIAYMGIVTEYSENDINVIHKEVYTTLKNETPPEIYEGLVADIEDRHDCLVSAEAFKAELSYFRVKPLYTGLVFLLHKAGVPLVLATLIPSFIAAFFCLLITFSWLLMYVKNHWALLLTIVLGLYGPFAEITELSTPDALSNMFILLSLYLVAKQKQSRIGLLLCLVLAVAARVDNFIFASVVIYFTYLAGRKDMILKLLILGSVVGLSIILVPVLMGNPVDWFMKFAYVGSLGDYWQHWRDVFYLFRHSAYDMVLLPVTIFLLLKSTGVAKTIMQVIVLTIAAHMLLFPSLQERFLVSYEFALVIMLVKFLTEKYGKSATANQEVLTAQ